MFVLFSLSTLLLAPESFAVKKLGKDSICKDTRIVALSRAFRPQEPQSLENLRQLVKVADHCPNLGLPADFGENVRKKFFEEDFLAEKTAFEQDDLGTTWELLEQKAALAGVRDLGERMRPRLENARRDCEGRDQRGKLPAAWDQGNQGWCYGYAAAAIASYVLEEPISPDATALRYAVRNGWEGGNLQEALEIGQEGGFCQASNFPFSSRLQMAGYDPIRNSGEEIRNLAREFDEYDGGHSALPEDQRCRDLLSPSALDFAAKLRLTSTELVSVLLRASGENMVKRYLTETCVPSKKPLRVKFRSVRLDDPRNPIKTMPYESDYHYPAVIREEARRQVQAALRENKVVGIGTFDFSVIGAGDKNHAMVIVGQEWDERERQCRLILRNSWGVGCRPEAGDFARCDGQGNYSVPISRVLRHKFSFTFYD